MQDVPVDVLEGTAGMLGFPKSVPSSGHSSL